MNNTRNKQCQHFYQYGTEEKVMLTIVLWDKYAVDDNGNNLLFFHPTLNDFQFNVINGSLTQHGQILIIHQCKRGTQQQNNFSPDRESLLGCTSLFTDDISVSKKHRKQHIHSSAQTKVSIFVSESESE